MSAPRDTLLPYNFNPTGRQCSRQTISGASEETCVLHDSITDIWVIPETSLTVTVNKTHFRGPPRFQPPPGGTIITFYHSPVLNPHPRRRTQRTFPMIYCNGHRHVRVRGDKPEIQKYIQHLNALNSTLASLTSPLRPPFAVDRRRDPKEKDSHSAL